MLVIGRPAVVPFVPPQTLVGSPECVAQTTLVAMLHTRFGVAPLRGVRASIREGGCGGMLGACNGEGLALELCVESGTPIFGLALELRPPAQSILLSAAGSTAGELLHVAGFCSNFVVIFVVILKVCARRRGDGRDVGGYCSAAFGHSARAAAR